MSCDQKVSASVLFPQKKRVAVTVHVVIVGVVALVICFCLIVFCRCLLVSCFVSFRFLCFGPFVAVVVIIFLNIAICVHYEFLT